MTTAPDIADRLGLRKYARSWRGDCPACSYHAAFALLVGKSGAPRPWCANGCTCEELTTEIDRILGGGLVKRAEPASTEETKTRNRERAQRLWNGSSVTGLHHSYLAARGLPGLAASPGLRFRGDCTHPECGGTLPAMVALVQDVTGATLGAHRTYLRPDGTGKADVTPQKASLGPIWGGAIRLDPLAEEMVIGEGIETAASAGLLLGLPAWAAISAGNMGKGLILPAEVRSVVIAADPGAPGEREAMNAARRWAAEGRHVRIARTGSATADFNDILRERSNHA